MKLLDLIPTGGNIAVIGGGGKTGLLQALESGLYASGHAALVTVTTRLGRWQFPHLTAIEASTQAEAQIAVRRASEGERILLTGPPTAQDIEYNKYNGVPTDWFPTLRHAAYSDMTFLIEADGSMGRPLKVHREGEPVLPPLPCFLVAVLGLSALNLPAGEAAHRPELLADFLGPVDMNYPLSPEQVVLFVKEGWKKFNPDLIFLNQTDALKSPAEKQAGEKLARLLKAGGFKIMVGSLWRNEFMEQF